MRQKHIWVGPCQNCGNEFSKYAPPSRAEPKFCSKVCTCKAFTGTKQSPEQIEKRIRKGKSHYQWLGDSATVKAGRTRALRAFEVPTNCEACGEAKRLDRHHKDGNTLNNDPSNIKFLCRKCHMIEDGRLERFMEVRHNG